MQPMLDLTCLLAGMCLHNTTATLRDRLLGAELGAATTEAPSIDMSNSNVLCKSSKHNLVHLQSSQCKLILALVRAYLVVYW